MSKQPHQYQKRRAVRSYFGIVFSVSLILFVVGVLSLLLLNARQVSQHVKEQIVLPIFIDDNAKKEISTLKETFEKQRKIFLDLYEPSYALKKTPPEILAMQEQLYIDVVASSVFKFDSDKFEKLLVDDVASLLTRDELLELKEIHQRPVFKKLESINDSMLKTTEAYLGSWQEENLQSMEKFKEKNDEILVKSRELLELRKKEKL